MNKNSCKIKIVSDIIKFVTFLPGTDHGLVRRKRAFGSAGSPCNSELVAFFDWFQMFHLMLVSLSDILFFLVVIHGAYLERWDRIDYKRVKFLLGDPRYPNLPSLATCVPTFEQPSRWADFFGSRLRTYFVPFQTGNHYFFLCKILLFT